MNLKILFFPLSVMLSLGMLIWVVKPEWDNIQKTKTEMAAKSAELANADKQVSMLEKALAQYKNQVSDKQLIMIAIPESRAVDDLFVEIYQKVMESEILLTGIDYTPGDSTAKCASANAVAAAATGATASTGISKPAIPNQAGLAAETMAKSGCILTESYSVNVIGSYLNTKKLINELPKINRYIDITDVLMNKAENEAGDIITSTIKFNVYYKPANNNFTILDVMTTPTGQVLLAGKIEVDVLEKFKSNITSRQFVPVTVGETGKEDIFKSSISAPTPAPSTTQPSILPPGI